MDTTLVNFLIGFFTASLLGFIIFFIFFSYAQKESRGLINSYYQLQVKYAKASQKIQDLEYTQGELKNQFENIANSIITQKGKMIEDQNRSNIQSLLEPFKENIKDFNQKIDTYYYQEAKERYSLIKEIEKLQKLNYQISQDAINLTNALKGENKVQGDWGEYILQRVLESSGLKEGREYEIQKEFKGPNQNRLRPDIIIHLPGNKDIIIDSKLSLTAYERYYTATNEDIRENELQKHLLSINKHIKELNQKEYEKIDSINSLDFVLMFIPIEAAFLLAIEKDRELYQRAYSKNIIIVSPSTLLAVLRTIENSWRYEYRNKNAQIIAKQAGLMHDKFVAFVEEMTKIDKALQMANKSYEQAFKRLSSGKGNLISRAKALRELEGVYNKKIEKE